MMIQTAAVRKVVHTSHRFEAVRRVAAQPIEKPTVRGELRTLRAEVFAIRLRVVAFVREFG